MAKIDNSKQQVFERNVKHNRWAIAAVVLFVACALSTLLFGILSTPIVFSIIIILAIGAFACSMQIKDSSKEEQLSVIESERSLSPDAIRDDLGDDYQVYGRNGLPLEYGEDGYVMSKKVNGLYSTLPIWAVVPEELYKLPEKTIKYTAYLKGDRDKQLSKFAALRPNKAVMGLSSDINEELFNDEHPTVEMHLATRFAVQVTDDAAQKSILNKKRIKDRVVFDGHELSDKGNGALISISMSELVNEVDIHSLMISNDGYIMFARGTKEHPLRPGKVISSASCSFLPTEFEDGRPVQESMIESIHNKIHVLYDIPTDTEIKSSFCGFARMLPRGGAPEFYCLTRIDLSKDELIKAHRDVTSEFIDETLESVVPELTTVEDAAEYIRAGIKKVRENAGDLISLSASAMLTAIDGAMSETASSRKALRRIGVIEHE